MVVAAASDGRHFFLLLSADRLNVTFSPASLSWAWGSNTLDIAKVYIFTVPQNSISGFKSLCVLSKLRILSGLGVLRSYDLLHAVYIVHKRISN